MGVSEDITTGFLCLYTMERTGNDRKKLKRTGMEGMSAEKYNKISFKFYMIATFRQSWKRKKAFLAENEEPNNKNHPFEGESHHLHLLFNIEPQDMVWLDVRCTPKAKRRPKKSAINSSCSKIRWQQQTNGFARKMKNRCLILPHLYDFPLPDLLIDLSDLHRYKSPHPNLCLVPLCLVSLLCNCSEWVGSWLAWRGGGAISNCGGY